MKKTYTLNFIFGLTLLMFGFTVQAQDDCPPQEFPDNYFWGTEPGQGDFSNGFGNWTTNVLSSDSTENWEIIPDGLPAVQTFFGGNVLLESPTACNGAAHYSFLRHQTIDNPDYDQPYYDYKAELISPIIDCSGRENVALEFYVANNPLGGENTYEISTDGGESWYSAQPIPYSGTVNSSVHVGKVLIPIPEFADVTEARIKFTASGNFYYLSIDDVALFEATTPDLYVVEGWVAGALNYGVPLDQVVPMPIMADVENESPVPSENSVMTTKVYKFRGDGSKEEVFESIHEYGLIRPGLPIKDENGDPAGDGWNQVHDQLYTPDEIGFYEFEYVIYDELDQNHSNDTFRVDFQVTENDFRKVLPEDEAGVEYLSASRFGSDLATHAFGTAFYVKKAEKEDGTARRLDGVRLGFGPNQFDNDAFTAGKVYLELYSWEDVDGNGVANPVLDAEGNIIGHETTLLGSTSMNVTPNTDPLETADIVMVPEDEEGDIVVLEDETQYIALLIFEAFEGEYFHIKYAPSSYRQFYDAPAEYAYDTLGLTSFKGTMGAVGENPDALREGEIFTVAWGSMFIHPLLGWTEVSTNDINKDLGVSVYPTLASEVINVEFSLEALSPEVNVELISIDGRVIQSKQYKNVQSNKVSIDVTGVTAGSYLVNIRTEEGMISKKVNIIK